MVPPRVIVIVIYASQQGLKEAASIPQREKEDANLGGRREESTKVGLGTHDGMEKMRNKMDNSVRAMDVRDLVNQNGEKLRGNLMEPDPYRKEMMCLGYGKAYHQIDIDDAQREDAEAKQLCIVCVERTQEKVPEVKTELGELSDGLENIPERRWLMMIGRVMEEKMKENACRMEENVCRMEENSCRMEEKVCRMEEK